MLCAQRERGRRIYLRYEIYPEREREGMYFAFQICPEGEGVLYV
jgi:hypothetical protein